MNNLYQLVGGIDACRRLSVAFYARVGQDPVLRPLFPASMRCAIDALTAFLAQFLGGPNEYSERRWSLSLREAHQRFKIGQAERDAWLENMLRALDDVGIEQPANDVLRQFFASASADLINHPKKPSVPIQHDLAERWTAYQIIEELVGAIRSGDAQRALSLAESPVAQSCFEQDPGAFLSVLAMMSGSASPNLLDHVHDKLRERPELVRERYTYGRTLLHEVAAGGNLAVVKHLLELGADPNAQDKFGHTPLYCVGNQCLAESGGEVVHALAQAGARLDIQDKAKRCTALHMAARRGTMSTAEALLDCGANFEVRDSAGETPLRRAVNCGQKKVAALLLSRGADVRSKDRKGKTPVEAARTEAMKRILKDVKSLQSFGS